MDYWLEWIHESHDKCIHNESSFGNDEHKKLGCEVKTIGTIPNFTKFCFRKFLI